MKFGKSLSNQIEETLPEWRDKFLSYKELKKKLKLIDPTARAGVRPGKRPRIDGGDSADGLSEEEAEFIQLLENELEKFNSFFVEKEEEYIIRLKDLQDRVAISKDFSEEIIKIKREIVDFHGEMVLLENYSALNYTGLVKILKKYDKRTGALIRSPFIQKVLQQPFFTTDLLYKLVKECEAMLDHLFPKMDSPSSDKAVVGEDGDAASGPSISASACTSTSIDNEGFLKSSKELKVIEHMESLYMKSAVSALRVLKEIRSKSSTVSFFSLPPLQMSGVEGTWKKIPILEQVAK
ncbi:hypothetical protein SAY87_005581 [Trapa incisa]|uniref:SPX domain-containing protein n=1 Tax=Trapa incisa TaxID=236973 RepID=A0AAN7KA38_9MYRT|nr:hypothetical protein SAY87_005581 [Trapa incisa]